ncbi:hypothetical protein BS329_39340 [Amycolatopsis coloradensis]|uniref:HTH cro/C1-type domain-containing protein n=1 Tax=Amycolatopsis coloradensis TaxID=76021 RepID=A0A1R0KE98_9PSEU|nr:NACHT domain-containing protein [Amycolatopsis coloradensis]OLZ43383.1 hypothetical protein BS329_39340 [Amycolatopsis coloradensis]
MGRRQRPLNGIGPKVRFAQGMRGIRRSSGLTLRELAARSGYAFSTLSAAEQARAVPSWAVTEAFVEAAGGELASIKVLWERAQCSVDVLGLVGEATRRHPHRPIAVSPPPVPDGFLGRTEELAFLASEGALAPRFAKTSVIEGPAGVGKTALAARITELMASRYPGGQVCLDLYGSRRDEPSVNRVRALRALLTALGVPPRQVPRRMAERVALYHRVTANRRVLVLLDDAENAEQVSPLIPLDTTCAVLVTSRFRLTGLVLRHQARRLSLDRADLGSSPASMVTRTLTR